MRQAMTIEDMRIKLSMLVVAKKFNMQDPEVLSLSTELDRLIVNFEKAKQRLALPRDEYTVRLKYGWFRKKYAANLLRESESL